MADNGVVDKVAARLTLDISPAQQALLQLSDDIKKFGSDASVGMDAGGAAQQQAQQRANQKLEQNQQMFEEKLRQIQQDGDVARLMAANMANQQMVQMAADAALERELFQKQSDQRLELQQQQHTQRMLQSQQMYEERMKQLQDKGNQSNGFSDIPVVGSATSHITSMAKDIAAGMAIFSVVDELSKIPKTIEDVSASMTKLKQVLELSDQIHSVQQLNSSVADLQGVAERMAVVYGENLTTVLDVMTEAGRRFKDIPSIIVATDNALQAMVVDNVDATTAIKGEEAILSQFNMTLGQTKDTWAKITVASHEFMSSTTDIINGLERSGSAFNSMKINSDGAIAALVALQQESGRTGSVVGNSWKSIENTLASKKGVEALHELGIEAKTSNGSLVDGLTILGQLQAKWPQLSEASRNAFASILAGGKYQYGMLLTFLDNTSGTYVKALNAMKQANEQTQQELVNSALQSLPKQMQMTSAALQDMSVKFTNGVTPAMLSFFQDIRNGAKYIGDHAATIEHLISVGAKLAEAYVLWKVGVATYTAVMESATAQTIAATAANVKLDLALGSVIGRKDGMISALSDIGSSMLSMASSAVYAAGKVAALFIATNMLNDVANRAADPLTAKENDLEAQKRALQDSMSSDSFSSWWSKTWDHTKGVVGNLLQGHVATAMTEYYGIDANGDSDAQVQAKINAVDKQIADVKKQKQDQINKDAADLQKTIDDAMKSVSDPKNPPPPPLGNGPDNITPTSGKTPKGPSAAQVAQPYTDQVHAIDEGLGPYINMNKELDSILGSLNDQQTTLADKLKYGAQSMSLASASTQVYHNRLSALKSQQESLHATNDQIRADMAKVAAQMQALNPNNADPTTLGQGQQQALQSLSQEYDKLSQQLDSNSKKWQDDAKAMVQATDDWLNNLYQLQQNGLTPLTNQMNNIDSLIKTDKASMSLADNSMKHGDMSDYEAAQYAEHYKDELDQLIQKQQVLHQEADQHRADINELSYTLRTLDPTIAGYDAAVQSLTNKINEHKQAISDLGDQWSQTALEAQSAIDTMMQKVEDSLKAGYSIEQKQQQDQLKDIYDAKIKGLTDQKNAVDALIQSLQRQWQLQQANEKLTDLQQQEAQIKSQQDHLIVGLDGKVQRTYDLQKVADLDKQISDQQTQIAHDAQIQQLQDQKAAIDQQIQATQAEYNQKKQQLDDYWNYRMQQDQLKSEADQDIIKKGYKQALLDAQSFATQMNAIYASINMASVNAGGAVSAGLPGGTTNAGSNSQSLQQLIQSAGQQWQNASTQAEKDAIHQALQNQLQGSGASYNSNTGQWSLGGVILNGPQAGHPANVATTQGYIPKFAKGGAVPNIGSGGVDSVLTLQTPGEIVAPSFADIKQLVLDGVKQSTTTISKPVTITVQNVHVNEQSDLNHFLDLVHSVVSG